jgi:hypothetical protein
MAVMIFSQGIQFWIELMIQKMLSIGKVPANCIVDVLLSFPLNSVFEGSG